MIKCIIADDEQPARELLKMHLNTLPDLELSATFDNGVDAFNFLQRNPVDLVFLDIRMPKMSGLELIKSLKVHPVIILTTAFREYAAEGFELDVLDYLVKPITQERFMKAISKYHYYRNNLAEKSIAPDTFESAYIFLKVGKEQVRINLKDILYIEGLKDYIKLYTTDKMFVAYNRLNYMQAKLPETKFVRIHKSFIVAVNKISTYNNEQVIIQEKPLPVGRFYKKEFMNSILKSTATTTTSK